LFHTIAQFKEDEQGLTILEKIRVLSFQEADASFASIWQPGKPPDSLPIVENTFFQSTYAVGLLFLRFPIPDRPSAIPREEAICSA
jgi:hypothetical protein